ncbi:hypothetical protein HU200_009292 [Digitaria exilis]|uniref:Uncharacterized protein n=1 Tax=Digitaria exilis TaxID=1010633 RepID=A0A835FL94_9POAL|nr:hypothetical protein HU200_061605 [Digitaria exilis]KAF8762592.1 hypothetical protein HU200_009292 [Digitaria exilis]
MLALRICPGSVGVGLGMDRGVVHVPMVGIEVEVWWNSSVRRLPKEQGRRITSILIYTAWNIWKEGNRRVFDGITASPQRVLELKEEMQLREGTVSLGTLP